MRTQISRSAAFNDVGDQPASTDRERIAGRTVDIMGVTHRYGGLVAVDNISLPVAAGEVIALLGPSGCGKTTLLRIVAGFVAQSEGTVAIDGRSIDDLPPNLRSVGIVFQSYALFPHMTVAENVAYGLRARRRPSSEVNAKVTHLLDVVQLAGLADRPCVGNIPCWTALGWPNC